MRLVDLDPRWYCVGDQSNIVGLTFGCPHCPDSGIRLAVAVHLDGTSMDPDPDNPQQFAANEHVWALDHGSSFTNITLSPSVDASAAGHWHGYIKDGDIS